MPRNTKTRTKIASSIPVPISADFTKHNTYHLSFVVKAQCSVAHLVVVIVGGLVVLVVILLIVHRVRVDLVPVDILSARATAALDDVLLGDGLEVAVVLFVLVV